MTPDAVFEAFNDQATAWINTIAMHADALPVPYAFTAGLLATLNPCGFVMLPAFAAFYTNAGAQEQRLALRLRVGRGIWMGLLCTVSFVAVFTAIGLIFVAGGRIVMEWARPAGFVVGVILVAFGLLQLALRRSFFADATAGLRVQRSRTTVGVMVFGAGYAVSSLGCALPAFLVVAGSVFIGNGDASTSLLRFVEYSAGMGAVLTVVAVVAAVAREQAMRIMRPLLPVVDVAANVFVILAGLYVVWYWGTKGVGTG